MSLSVYLWNMSIILCAPRRARGRLMAQQRKQCDNKTDKKRSIFSFFCRLIHLGPWWWSRSQQWGAFLFFFFFGFFVCKFWCFNSSHDDEMYSNCWYETCTNFNHLPKNELILLYRRVFSLVIFSFILPFCLYSWISKSKVTWTRARRRKNKSNESFNGFSRTKLTCFPTNSHPPENSSLRRYPVLLFSISPHPHISNL